MLSSSTRSSRTATRIVLGLMFLLSGLNHFFFLAPMPPMSGATALFFQGLRQTGYFFPLLAAMEMAAGVLFLRGRWLPLALAIAAPIAVNVAAFHAVLAPQGLPIAALLLVAGGYLGWRQRQAFAPLVRARPTPAGWGTRAIEVILGAAFVASGILGLLGRTPPASTSGAAVTLKGLAAAGYFLPLLSGVQVVAGALLVARRFVGLALWALAPLVVHILAYRLYVATPGMLLVGLALFVAEVRLALAHRALFAGFFGGGTTGSIPLASVPRAAAAG